MKFNDIIFPVDRLWDKEIWGGFKQGSCYFVGKNNILLTPEYFNREFPDIKKRYPDTEVTLKMFDGGGAKVDLLDIERTIIQNIAWMLGFAPRVYELLKIEHKGKKLSAQVTGYVDGEFVEKEEGIRLWDIYEEKLSQYHIRPTKVDHFQANFIADKLVDFGLFEFSDEEKYKADLYKRFNHVASWGNNKRDTSYQNIEEIGISGGRTTKRFELLGLDKLDLRGKTVLDIGCSGGQVLYWAKKHGADRVVGIDLPEIADVSFEMANYNGRFSIETVGSDLKEADVQKDVFLKTGLSSFDIVTMFSVNHHVGFHKYMRDMCKGTLYLETNAARTDEEDYYPEQLKKLGYKSFEHKGQVDESGGRSLFVCK